MTTAELTDPSWDAPPSVVGLEGRDVDALATDLLGAIPWDGVELDPETTPAEVFLATVW
ncbi:MAG: hypothetical protein U0414_03810 [Polyangiaceae bacterium]